EAIVDYLAQHPHRRPLIVHLCGKFHCEYGLGTAARVLARRPILQLGIVTMAPAEDKDSLKGEDHRDRAHFRVAVQPEPQPDAAEKAPSSDAAKAKEEAPEASKPSAESRPQQPKAADDAKPVAPSGAPAEEKQDPSARPALGIMPDYGATDPGVTIASASDDG